MNVRKRPRRAPHGPEMHWAPEDRRRWMFAIGLTSVGVVVALASLTLGASAPDGRVAGLWVALGLVALVAAVRGGFGIDAVRTRRAARGRSGRVWLPAHGPSERPRNEPRRPGLREAISLAGLLFVGALLTSTVLETVTSERSGALSARPENGRDPRSTRPEEQAQTPAARTGRKRGTLLRPGLGGENGLASEASLLSTEPVLEVRRLGGDPDRPRSAMHLRGFVLEGYAKDGVPVEVPEALRDVEGGLWRNGESAVVDPLGETPAGAHDLVLHGLTPLRPSAGVVFAPAPLAAVVARRATVDERRGLVALDDPDRPYTVASAVRDLDLRGLRSSRARHPDRARLTALPAVDDDPAAAAALQRIAALGERLTAQARTDFDRVVAVVDHFRKEYGYDLFDTRFQSPLGCAELVDRRTGSCTHFASAAQLVLRLSGLPTRIAAGYVAREPLEGGGWLVRMRDGHAWVEVHFEGVGWLAFDPTPPAEDVANPAWAPIDVDGAAGGDGPSFAGLGRRVARALGLPGALAAALLLGAWLAVTRAGGARREWSAPGEVGKERGAPAEHATTLRRLVRALADRGLVQRASETPLAFARRCERGSGLEAGTLEAALASLLRAATRGVSLAPEDTSRIEAISAQLERQEGPRAP